MTPTRNPKYTSQRAHVFRPNTLIHHGPNQTITVAEARNRNIPFAHRSGPPPQTQNKKPIALCYTRDPIDLSPPSREYYEDEQRQYFEQAGPLFPERPVPVLNTEPFGFHLSHVELRTAQDIAKNLHGAEVLPRGNYNFIIITFLWLPDVLKEEFTAYIYNPLLTGIRRDQVRPASYKPIR